MGLFDMLFGKKNPDTKLQSISRGCVTTTKIDISAGNYDAIKHKFIAFDTETTGLSCDTDRIVELGAVEFEDGRKISEFGTLVNPGIPISSQATAVNNITNQMLKSAPDEPKAYGDFCTFLGKALAGEVVVCAHNATFDMKFLAKTLERLGYSGNINYIDTLSLSRRMLKELPNHKQPTVARYFGHVNAAEHRAESDAEVCGNILVSLLQLMEAEISDAKKEFQKKIPNEEEQEYCAYIQRLMVNAGADSDWLKFYRNSASYVDVAYLYELFKFKMAKKGNYIIVGKNDLPDGLNLATEACTATEGGDSVVRVFFQEPSDLDIILPYMMKQYNSLAPQAQEYISNHRGEVEATYGNWFSIDDSDVNKYIEAGYLRRQEEAEGLLRAEEAKSKLEEEKKLKKELAKKKKEENTSKTETKGKRSGSRAILQMDDDMQIIRRYESLQDAINETGINSKSIRDAAKGVQKHAGGFVWRYVEEQEDNE